MRTLLLILISVMLCACADDKEQLTSGQFGAVIMVCMLVAGVIVNFWERRK